MRTSAIMVVSNAFEIELSNDTKLVASKTLKANPKENSLEERGQRGIITQFSIRGVLKQKLQRQHFSIPFLRASLDL